MAIHHQENLTKLAGMPGILAACSIPAGMAGGPLKGDTAWHGDILLSALHLFKHLDDDARKKPIRVTAGDLTILAVDFGHERAGVVFPTGHEVAKSVQRSMRRMSRKTPKPSPEGADQG